MIALQTTMTAVDKIFSVLDASDDLKSLISGSLYKYDSRPQNSDKEDIVVNAITMLDGVIQSGVCNVNIHVPDKDVADETAYYKVPDIERLGIILGQVSTALGGNHGIYFSDGTFSINKVSNPIKEEGLDDHYLNLRLRIEYHNQN